MDQDLRDNINQRLFEYEHPTKLAFSSRFPMLKKPVIAARRSLRSAQDACNLRIKYTRTQQYFSCIVARHQSVLRRRLGDSKRHLQEKKIVNLTQAVKRLNGVIIQPGDIFSLWQIIGRPSYRTGYVDGMLLANGQVVEGLGAGCVRCLIFCTGFFCMLHLK